MFDCMLAFRPLPAALIAALGIAAASAAPAHAATPVAIEGADEDTRKAILHLLPERAPPQTLFDAERLGEEAAASANAWLRSEGYYDATVTPQAQDNPPSAHLVIAPGTRFKFAAPELEFEGAPPDAATEQAARNALRGIEAGAPARAAHVLETE